MQRQADWLADLRSQLYRKANIRTRHYILDIGCGSGIITKELFDRSKNIVTGVDINPDRINNLSSLYPDISFVCADALNLPFPDSSFDLIVSSWLWVWIKDKHKFATEIIRLLKPGGVYISMAETDSAARIEYPEFLEPKKQYFQDFITGNGGDPFIARKIPALFNNPDLNVQAGAFCSMFSSQQLFNECDKDYDALTHLVKDMVKPEEIEHLKQLELKAISDKTRFSFVPIFWTYVTKS